MWSGGIVKPVDNADDVVRANDELLSINRDYADKSGEVRDANNALEDAGNELRDARTQTGEEKGEEAYHRSQARGKEEQAKAAREAADNYVKRTQEELKRLEPEFKRINSQFDLARFQKWLYMEETRRMFTKGRGELFLEQQARDAEIWRFIHAAISKMGQAFVSDLTSRLSASLALNFPSYFAPPSPPNDSSQQTDAAARASLDTVRAQEANVHERLADPYYANEAGRKAGEANVASADHARAKARADGADSAEKAALAGWESARSTYNETSDAAQDAKRDYDAQENELKNYDARIRQKQMEQQQQAQRQQQQRGTAARAGA